MISVQKKTQNCLRKEICVVGVKFGGNRFLGSRNEALFCLKHTPIDGLHPTLHKIIPVVKPSWRPLADIKKPASFLVLIPNVRIHQNWAIMTLNANMVNFVKTNKKFLEPRSN